jgi:hypothetical protein
VSIEATHVSGTWWRHTPAGADVLRQPADAPDMRWQHGEIVEGLYLADSPETVCVFREVPQPPGTKPVPPPERFDEPPAPPPGMRT